MSMTVTSHFQDRVRERIGDHVNPFQLARALLAEIDDPGSPWVSYIGRSDDKQARKWRFKMPDGSTYVAVIDMTSSRPVLITVVPDDQVPA